MSGLQWPPPLMTSEPGSFAWRTIVERKPQIIQRVVEDNAYSPTILEELASFKQEIAAQAMHPVREQAPDANLWNEALTPYRGRTWLQAPWYFAESFFYRRVLEAVRYFQPGAELEHDPFEAQKRIQIDNAVQHLAQGLGQLEGVAPPVAFEALLHSCLWGNRADLSNYTVVAQASAGLATRDERHNILIDHTDDITMWVMRGLQRIDCVTDNVGLELLFDLALADLLLRRGWVQEVVLHLKDHPFFVSDAMPKDVWMTLRGLQAASDAHTAALGMRLSAYIETGRLQLKDDPFWTSHRMFRQMPAPLQAELGRSDLVILKGDVNYRRLLDDRHWPFTAIMDEIVGYFPASLLVLRTLKGEIMVGLQPGQADSIAAADPTWLINGKRGVIQSVKR